ncbi:MAG: helix-turn-helix domain-containing protein [Candidatus Omnitrophota bacterium]
METKCLVKFDFNIEDIGKRFKLFRKSHNLTIPEIADQTSLSRDTLTEVEAGKTKPSAILMLALFKLYGLNINWWLSGKGKMIEKWDADYPKGDEEISTDTYEDDYNQLLWYLENAPVAKYAVLGFFQEYIHKNKDIVDENIRKALKKK